MQHWALEGITGRGVLLDYASWAAEKGIRYSAFSDHAIGPGELRHVAKQHGIMFERGDILLVRSGVTEEWDERITVEEKRECSVSSSPKHVGVEATIEMLRWIWDTRFAAVAGDAISFEVYPPESDSEVMLHDYLLAGWDMLIGEPTLPGLSQVLRIHSEDCGSSFACRTSLPNMWGNFGPSSVGTLK